LGRKPFLPWLKVTLYQVFCRVLFNFNKHSLKINAFASDKSSIKLVHSLKKLEHTDFDLIMAHSYGAMYPAYFFSKKHKIPFIFDIEDYHPGESINKDAINERSRREFLMRSILPKSKALTYASELIGAHSLELIKTYPKHILLLNSFSADDFKTPIRKNKDKIQCVWFSQHIGPNRGLEQIFESAKYLTHMEFHLIGNRNQDYLSTIVLSDNIILHDIMEQSKLHAFLASMDIGLALEPGRDLNNSIALSNKIITYAQAGLFILATDTLGQSQFLNALDYEAGHVMNADLVIALQQLDQKLLSVEAKMARWKKAKCLSWEHEQLKLKELFQ
jgi:hypothetical protein